MTTTHHHQWDAAVLLMGVLLNYGDSAIADPGVQTVSNFTDGFPNVTSLCPGLEGLVALHGSNLTTLVEHHAPDCESQLPEFTAHQGVVYGRCGELASTFCKLQAKAAPGKYIRARVERFAYWCGPGEWKALIYSLTRSYRFTSNVDFNCSCHSPEEIFLESAENQMRVLSYEYPAIRIEFETVETHGFMVTGGRKRFGHVIIPRMLITDLLKSRLIAEIQVPSMHVVMVSFVKVYEIGECFHKLDIIYRKRNATRFTTLKECSEKSFPARVLATSSLTLQARSFHKLVVDHVFLYERQIYFSFIPENRQPKALGINVFNCSVTHYSHFHRHLDCNLIAQCQDGRDESERCSFSSAGCQGRVASRGKCFQLAEGDENLSLVLAVNQCHQLGGRLASVKTREEQEDFARLFTNTTIFDVVLGFVSGWQSLPFMYSKYCKWSDNTLMYDMDHFIVDEPYRPTRLVQTMALRAMKFVRWRPLRGFTAYDMVCEISSLFPRQSSGQTLSLKFPAGLDITAQTEQSLYVCLDGYAAHTFSVCDSGSSCSRRHKSYYLWYCPFSSMTMKENATLDLQGDKAAPKTTMFRCDDGRTTVHYSLVCDFRPDCPDHSDEVFCQYPACSEFLCANGQCVSFSQRCNEFSDCLDDSDEVDCPGRVTYRVSKRRYTKQRHLLISLDGTGFFTEYAMTPAESCPETHYQCTPDSLHCLPVYTRCNGHSDCIYAEDEENCKLVTCPGFYQCRGSRTCVHGDHLCDGWGQCPQRDDELMCDTPCPAVCLCQGHSFLCHGYFPATLFPLLRYVDGTNTGMSLADFSGNFHLVYLTLACNALFNVTSVQLFNLQFLDLRRNGLEMINMSVFHELHQLRVLNLANNPLTVLSSISLKHVLYELKHMDISETGLQMLNSRMSIYMPKVVFFNISSTGIETIRPPGLKNIPSLSEVDIRRNPVLHFPVDLLSKLRHLNIIFTSNFRLCCENLLPKQSTTKLQCVTSQPMSFSCQNLLPSKLYLIFFSLVCASSILGNLVCFIGAFPGKKIFGRTFVQFFVNVQVANICMGINVAVVLIANELFHGKYDLFETTWTDSVACKLASFLSLLSTETSLLVVFFSTLNTTNRVCRPDGSGTFGKFTPKAVCPLAWLIGIVLSSVPFLPALSHWGARDQSGLCRLALFLAPSTRFRWFTATVALNVALSALVAVGLGVVYSRTPKRLITVDPATRPVYFSVQLLTRMGVTEVSCWVAFGVTSVVGLCGVGGGGVLAAERMHEALVVFALPLGSALNPLQYMWTISTLKQKLAQDGRLLEMLKSRLGVRSKQGGK